MINLRQEIVAGITLIREAIQSQNFIAGVAGWRIKANGDAEFNSIIVRGTLITGPTGSKHIEINGVQSPNGIAFYSGNVIETFPTLLQPFDGGTSVGISLQSPAVTGGVGIGAQLQVFNLSAGLGGHSGAQLSGYDITLLAANTVTINSPTTLVIAPILLETAWTNLPLAGTWVVGGGFLAQYFIDSTGRVQLRGQVVGGAAVGIGNLPVGYRPSQNMEWVMRAVGGVTMCAISVTTAGVVLLTANAAAAQATGVKLDNISFPAAF